MGADIMANEQNLVRGDDVHKFTHEEASKGGKRSAEVRRQKRDLRRALEILLEKDFKDRAGNSVSGAEAITAKLFEKAMKGDVRAFETLRDTVGQKPVDKVLIAEVDQDVIDEVEKAVLEDE